MARGLPLNLSGEKTCMGSLVRACSSSSIWSMLPSQRQTCAQAIQDTHSGDAESVRTRSHCDRLRVLLLCNLWLFEESILEINLVRSATVVIEVSSH